MTCVLLSAFHRENSGMGEGEKGGVGTFCTSFGIHVGFFHKFEPLFATLYFSYRALIHVNYGHTFAGSRGNSMFLKPRETTSMSDLLLLLCKEALSNCSFCPSSRELRIFLKFYFRKS